MKMIMKDETDRKKTNKSEGDQYQEILINSA